MALSTRLGLSLILCLSLVDAGNSSYHRFSPPDRSNVSSPRGFIESKVKWISLILKPSLSSYSTKTKNNTECNRQSNLYKKGLEESKLWAVQMYDSMGPTHSGVISGNVMNGGSFDECMAIKVPKYSLYGQYCVVKLDYGLDDPNFYITVNSTINETPGPEESVWAMIQRKSDPRFRHRDTVYWGMCFPDSCSAEDISISLSEHIIPLLVKNGIKGNVTVSDEMCQSKKENLIPDYKFYIYLGIIGFFLLLCINVSIYDSLIYNKEQMKNRNTIRPWFLQFSMVATTRNLMKPDIPKEFQFLSGMKFLSLILIIYGHRMLSILYTPLLNTSYHEERYGQFLETMNFNGPIIVNTFLLISGFLTYYKLLNDIDKKRIINVPIYILYRWLRVTPVYMTVIGFSAFVGPFIRGGPLWKTEALWRHEACRKYWWTHILYINNYYQVKEECLIPSWYMAVDMQLYVVCVILGYILWKKRIIAHILLATLFILSVIVPIYVVYNEKYDAIIKFYINYLQNYYAQDDYINSYTRTHMRAAPYFIGMGTALVYRKLHRMKFKFNWWQMTVGSLLVMFLSFGNLLSAWVFFIPGRANDHLENGLYASLHRVGWSLAFSIFIILHGITGYGIFGSLLNHRIYGPLSKLTLGALLVHTLLQQLLYYQQRAAVYVNNAYVYWMASGDIMSSYLIALGLYILIEAPIAAMQERCMRQLFAFLKNRKLENNKPSIEEGRPIYITSLDKQNEPQ